MKARGLITVVALIVPLLGASSAAAVDSLVDLFDQKPADSGNWCERHLAVTWNEANQWMLGTNADCCVNASLDGSMDCNGSTCAAVLNGERNFCESCDATVNAIGCEHLIISQAEFSGDLRIASVEFGLSQDLPEGPDGDCVGIPAHVKVSAVAHPHCDARIEARLVPLANPDPDTIASEYALEIQSITTARVGYPECDEFNGQAVRINEPLEVSVQSAPFVIATSTFPLYELTLETSPSATNPATEVSATARLRDPGTEQVIAELTHPNFFRPAWYDVAGQGRRMAFGGSRSVLAPANILDNFSGISFEGVGDIPDPSDPAYPNGAPTVDPTVPTTMKDSTSFLYEAADPLYPVIQTGLTTTIEDERAAVIRGLALDVDGNPLSEVVVSILEDPGFGQTRTRANGEFDLAVNGGGTLTVVYELDGHLTAHRKVDVPWQDYVTAEDVALVPYDVASVVTLSVLTTNDEIGVHEATPTVDDDSPVTDPRTAALLFFPGTTAMMTLGDGSQQSLDTLTVRATEYTVSETKNGIDMGPRRMPAPLPSNTAYTYAVELSIDEAEAAGATRVDFIGNPVVFYIQNFLDIPADDGFGNEVTVPTGYYDRELGLWIPADSGHIIDVTGVNGGLAQIDPAVLAALNISPEEQEEIATLYGGPVSLWRVEIPHFTVWDMNWPFGPPPGSGGCPCSGPSNGGGGPKGPPPACSGGSVIGCQTQTLGESIDVVGTPYSLHYQSERMPGREAGRTLTIPLQSTNAAQQPTINNLVSVELEIQVAGQIYTKTILPSGGVFPDPEQFTWDGLDAYGRDVYGRVPVLVRVGYRYSAQYGRVTRFGYIPESLITGSVAREEIVFWESFEGWVDNWDARTWGLGGWTFDVHHLYDRDSGVLLRGDGTSQSVDRMSPIVSLAAGSGTNLVVPDGELATEVKLTNPGGVAVGPDGSIYIGEQYRVRRVAPDGTISLFAGTFTSAGWNGDVAADATTVTLGRGDGIAIGPDGSVYVADGAHRRIRRIFDDGSPQLQMETVAGATPLPCPPSGCGSTYNGDGIAATSALLSGGLGVAIGPDGRVYIADAGNHRVRRIGFDGIITTVAGTGSPGTSPDGTQALAANLERPESIAFDASGNLYVVLEASFHEARVRRIGPDGTVQTVAGIEGQTGFQVGRPTEGSVATAAALWSPDALAVGPDGSLLISDRADPSSSAKTVVYRVSPAGILTTFAGTGEATQTGNGGPARLATFSDIRGMAFSPDGDLVVAGYGSHRVRRITNPLPEEPDPTGKIFIGSEDGSEIYVFDASGRHEETRDALTGGAIRKFEYNVNDGRLEKIVEQTGAASGNETTLTNPLWGDPDFPPMGSGKITSPGSQDSDFVLSPTNNGYLESFANPGNEAYLFAYTGTGLLTDLTDPRGNSWEFGYDLDGLGRLVRDADPEVILVDPQESFKTLVRDDASHAELAALDAADPIPDPYPSARTFRYKVDLETTVSLSPTETRLTEYVVEQFADDSVVRTTTAPDGVATILTVDPDDRRTRVHRDRTATVVTLAPDPRFGMSAPVLAQAVVTTPSGLLEMVANEIRTSSTDDPSQVVTSATRTLTIQGIGNPAGPDRVYTQDYSFDGGTTRLITETSPMGRVQRTTLDEQGRILSSEIDGLEATSFVYENDRLRWVRQGPADERERELTYDTELRLQSIATKVDVGRIETVTFGNYDGGNRPELVTLPDTNQLGFTYDPNGNVGTITPPGRPAHSFGYNKVNREVLYVPPALPSGAPADTGIDYDFAREAFAVNRPGGGVVDRQIDPTSGRLTAVVLPGSEGDLLYDYSGTDAQYGYSGTTGQVTGITGPALGSNRPVVGFEWDGFLLKSTKWTCEDEVDLSGPCDAGTVEGTVTEEYDDNFRRISQTVGGVAVTFEYDEDDLLEQTGALNIHRALLGTPDFSHGGVMGSTLGVVEDTYSYNDYGEIETYLVEETFSDPMGAEIFDAAYLERDDLGRITEKTEQVGGGDVYLYEYEYDSRGRLDLVTIYKNAVLDGTEDYEYDANGNRTDAPNLTGTPQYDNQDRLCVYGTTAYQYTDNGELAQKVENASSSGLNCTNPGTGPTTTYSYDALGNLREVTFPDGTIVDYMVDGLGRRIGKRVWNDVSQEFEFKQGFLYEDQLRIVAELDEFGAIKSRFVYGERVNVPEYMVQGNDTYRIVTDYLGSVRLVVNAATGAVVQQMEYDSFGRILPGKDTNPGFQPFGFAGGLYDVDLGTLPGTGFVRFGTRDYDPAVARWTAKDQIGFGGRDANLYGYVGRNPVNFADPSGEIFPAALLVPTAWVLLGTVGTGILAPLLNPNLAPLPGGAPPGSVKPGFPGPLPPRIPPRMPTPIGCVSR